MKAPLRRRTACGRSFAPSSAHRQDTLREGGDNYTASGDAWRPQAF